MKSSQAVLFISLVASLFCSTGKAVDSPDQRALETASASPMVTVALEKLIQEARKIHDKTLRESALRILARPDFTFLPARKSSEEEIKKKLLSEGLLASDKGPLFPTQPPTAFIIAPAGVWLGHHSYPGGLVVHTWTNLLHALSLAKDWKTVQKVTLNDDWLRAAVIWHDSAKTMTFSWNEDGSDNPAEPEIAGAGEHHVFGVTEAAFRELPPDFIVTLASAHSPALPEPPLQTLIGYLKAAAIIAGKPYAVVGLDPSGKHLLKPAPLESYINHLCDHDWVATEPVNRTVSEEIESVLKPPSHWERDRILSRVGELYLYSILETQGKEGLDKRIQELKSTAGFQ